MTDRPPAGGLRIKHSDYPGYPNIGSIYIYVYQKSKIVDHLRLRAWEKHGKFKIQLALRIKMKLVSMNEKAIHNPPDIEHAMAIGSLTEGKPTLKRTHLDEKRNSMMNVFSFFLYGERRGEPVQVRA